MPDAPKRGPPDKLGGGPPRIVDCGPPGIFGGTPDIFDGGPLGVFVVLDCIGGPFEKSLSGPSAIPEGDPRSILPWLSPDTFNSVVGIEELLDMFGKVLPGIGDGILFVSPGED